MDALAKLIEPVLILVCETFLIEHDGQDLSVADFQARLADCFEKIKDQCAVDGVLAHQYETIKQPLYFFIDYVVKEQNFSCVANYEGIGRSIDELSGDEKFFDLLSQNLSSTNSGDNGYPYFLFLCLGFNGMFKTAPQALIPYMEKLKLKLGLNGRGLMLSNDYLHVINQSASKPKKNTFKYLCLAALFLLAALIVNNLSFYYAKHDYEQGLDRSLESASRYFQNSNKLLDTDGAYYLPEEAQ